MQFQSSESVIPPKEDQNRERSIGNLLFKVFSEFCDATSMHGLGQMINHTVLVAKLVWLIAFLGAVGGNTYHIFTLIEQYTNRPVQESTSLQQKPIRFPAVTVCNIDPISRSNFEELANDPTGKVSKYMDRVARMRRNNLIDDDTYDKLLEPLNIRMNVGKELAKQSSHQIRDFILRCNFRGRPCNMTHDFKFILNALVFNCYTFDPGEKADNFSATGPESGLSMIFYLEASNGTRAQQSKFDSYDPDINTGNGLGVKVMIHPPGEYPIPHIEGLDIMPGHSTSYGIRVEEVKRLPLPYGDCIHNSSMDDLNDYRYSPVSCLSKCLQLLRYDKCNCMTPWQVTPDKYNNDSYCGTLVSDDDQTAINNFFNDTVCSRKAWLEFMSSPPIRDKCECHPRCEESLYSYAVTESKWPAPKYYNSFLQEEILDRDDRWSLKVYRQLWKVIEDHMYDHKEQSNYDFITENFARLNVYLKDMEVMSREQIPAYALSSLFSDIGGTLGLWAGLSLLTILELIQLGVRMGLVCTGKTNVD